MNVLDRPNNTKPPPSGFFYAHMKQTNKQAGGYARAASLTPERRTEIARNAVLKRWSKAGEKNSPEVPVVHNPEGYKDETP